MTIKKTNSNTKSSNLVNTVKGYIASHQWLILVAILWVLTYLPVSSFLSTSNRITVSGTSLNSAKNEVATFNVSVTTEDLNKEKAVEETNRKAQSIIDSIKVFGIPEEDIKTQNMNVYQKEEMLSSSQRYEKTNWVADVGVEVTLRDVARADELASMLTSMDISHMYGPNFDLDRTRLDETRLLQMALEDAHEKAGYIARKMNRRLGSVISIVEGGSSYSSYYPKSYEASGLGGSDMEPGTTDVSKSVTVTYRLR